MKISDFYKETLGANLANIRWSWGAYNPLTNQIFLRVWEDEIKDLNEISCAAILKKSWAGSSPGYNERLRHIEKLRDGASGYGVLCTAKDIPSGGSRTIKNFDKTTLLKLGEFVEDQNHIYSKIEGKINVAELARRQTAHSSILPDIKSILGKTTENTTKEILADARVGQGKFRSQVLELWKSKCCVTGCKTLDVIRASHIKPWRNSNDTERLDPYNGLPLIANIDALFDAGLVTFDPDGSLVVSSKIELSERKLLNVDNLKLTQKPPEQTVEFLKHHKANVFVE